MKKTFNSQAFNNQKKTRKPGKALWVGSLEPLFNEMLGFYKNNNIKKLKPFYERIKSSSIGYEMLTYILSKKILDKQLTLTERELLLSFSKTLLDKGVKTNVQDNQPTLLMTACKNNAKDFIKILLDAGADVNATVQGLRVLEVALTMIEPINDKLEIMKLLIAADAEINYPSSFLIKKQDSSLTILMYAVTNEELSVIEFLIANKAEIFYRSPKIIRNNVLMQAVRRNKQEILDYLLNQTDLIMKKYKEDSKLNQEKIRIAEEDLDLALIVAANKGYLDTIHKLLRTGANPLTVNDEANNPANCLITATVQGHFKVVYELLLVLEKQSTFSEFNKEQVQYLKNSALLAAISTHQPALVQLLLDKGSDPNSFAKDERPALALAVYQASYNEKTLEQLAAINKQSYKIHHRKMKFSKDKLNNPVKTNQNNPLKLSEEQIRNNVDIIIKLLLNKKYKTNMNQTNDTDQSPLLLATLYGKKELVKLLIDNGADPTIKHKNGETLIYFSVMFNRLDIIRYLSKIVPRDLFNSPLNSGITPIFYSIYFNFKEMVHFIYEDLKFDINEPCAFDLASGKLPYSPLMAAMHSQQFDMVKYFVAKGADIDRAYYGNNVKSKAYNFLSSSNDIFSYLLAEVLYKDLNIKRDNLIFDPVLHFVSLLKPLNAIMDFDKNILIKTDDLPDFILNEFKASYKHILMKKEMIKESVSFIADTYQNTQVKLSHEEFLKHFFEVFEDYRLFKENLRKQKLFPSAKGIKQQSELLYLSHKAITKDIGKSLNEAEEILRASLKALKENEYLDPNSVIGKNVEKRKKLDADKLNLDKIKNDFNNCHEQFKNIYHEKQELFFIVYDIETAEEVDIEKLESATNAMKTLQEMLDNLKSLYGKLLKNIEENKTYLKDLTSINERYQRHKESSTAKVKTSTIKENEYQKYLKQKSEEEEKVQKEAILKLELLKKAMLERKAIWKKKKEEIKRDRELQQQKIQKEYELHDKISKFNLNSNEQQSFNDVNDQAIITNKPVLFSIQKPVKPVKLNDHMPVSLQSGIGEELDQLVFALKYLKFDNNKPKSSASVAKLNPLIELEFKRRALLGLMTRIMEYLAQQKFSVRIPQDVAQHFRDLVFHGKVFPDIEEDKLKEALEWNKNIENMAESVLTFLMSTEHNRKMTTWEEAKKIINSDLFNRMLNTVINDNVDVKYCLESIKKEKQMLTHMDAYRNANGYYAQSEVLLFHGYGFTYGLLGAYIAKLKKISFNSYKKNQDEYNTFIEVGKTYRHLKEKEELHPVVDSQASQGDCKFTL